MQTLNSPGVPVDKYTPEMVFTPSSFPEFNYVQRGDQKLEDALRRALATRGQIASLTGPSKSGKTVLVEKVVGKHSLILVSGAELKSADDLWSRILDWRGRPVRKVKTVEDGRTLSAEVKAGGEAGIPFVAKGKAELAGGVESEHKESAEETVERRGLRDVAADVANTGFVVLVDDFHYVGRELQEQIAREAKEAARLGVQFCFASVPHRADDVIRANPDLRGRVLSIDTSYWRTEDLQLIATGGLGLLNVRFDDAVERFAAESAGSPQLMQAICLNACHLLELKETQDERTIYEMNDDVIEGILQQTCSLTNYSSLADILSKGPKERGVDRLTFKFRGGGEGDIYVCLLKAMRLDPPTLTFTYTELKRRIEELCEGDTPRGIGITNSVLHMHELALERMPKERAIDWDRERQVLDIVDPYFLFYIRWSGKF